MARLFGYTIEDKEQPPAGVVSPIPPTNDDGVEAFAGGGFFGSAFAKNLGLFAFAKNLGFSLVLGGIADLLAPSPPIPEEDQDPKSSAFTSPLNVSMPGIPVPLVYGTAICGSIVISADLEIQKVED